MDHISQFLEPIELDLDQLLLDPNNPRFSELGEDYSSVAESRFGDEKVQKIAFDKMRNPVFNVSELRDTIKTIGFLPMDRIVVKEWENPNGDNKYVIVEGNRRVTALKWLLQLESEGKETFTPNFRNNLTKLEALLINKELAPESVYLILPGLRHVSGIKEWGPYQKSKAVFHLRQTGLSPQEAAQSLGLSTRAANNSYRCFLALENMVKDEEYEDRVSPDMYSYFEEVFKRPAVRNWLEWDDNSETFKNSSNLSEFYHWITKPEDEDGIHKLPEARSVRDLAVIIADDGALNVFRSETGTLTRALAKYEVDHPEDWFPVIAEAAGALKSLTPETLRNLDEVSLEAIENLNSQIESTLADRLKLLS